MTRGRALAAAALLLAAAAGAVLLSRRDPPRPHIVVLLWDTTRADRLSAYGYPKPTTPWLEDLARRGVLFEQCRAPSPWTLPSHASLFTGLLPRHHGALQLESPLAPTHETLAERLRGAGYDTVLLSNNPLAGPQGGLAQGFDTYVSVPDARGAQGVGLTEEVLRKVLAERRADPGRAGRPLFLFVNLMEPHLPYDPPESVERPFRPPGAAERDVRDLKRFQFPEDMAHNLRIRPLPPERVAILSGLYDAEVAVLDAGCARIEALLREEGILDGGGAGHLLAVTSDHGENLGEHGLLDHKISLADTLLRVPLVIRSPGLFEGGRRVPAPVRLQDLHATLLQVAGVGFDAAATPHAAPLAPLPAEGRPQVAEFPPPLSFLDGLRRILPGQAEETFAPFRRGLLTAVGPAPDGRLLQWRREWTREPSGERTGVVELLFDLGADPGGTRDLLGGPAPAPADAAEARRLGALADDWVRPR